MLLTARSYDVKQGSTSPLTASIASDAGKVKGTARAFPQAFPPISVRTATGTDPATQDHILDQFELAYFLHIDGRPVQSLHLRVGESGEFLGSYNSLCAILILLFKLRDSVNYSSSVRFHRWFEHFPKHFPLGVTRKIQTRTVHVSLLKWGR
ncbi:hypothetical protein EDB85DRAFT_1088317 [Lactarius pseudohatsudake]|nr:hypothetical protein EDB85DRAFT_1088317 [Lactarius pseudohatsudake]